MDMVNIHIPPYIKKKKWDYSGKKNSKRLLLALIN